MSNEKYIVFPHPVIGGMTNLLIELEVRVILAELSGRTLVSLNKIPCWPQLDDHLYGRYRSAALLDLFDFPVKHISLTKLYKNGFETLYPLEWNGECASEAYFSHSSAADFDSEIVNDFKEAREQCWTFPENDYDAWFALNPRRTFCNYAYFFLASESVKRQIRKTASRIQPKAPYLNFAKTISNDLKKYNCIHVRLGDFKRWWIKSPTPKEIVENISKVISKDLPLLICTDNSQDQEFFAPIIRAFPGAIFIDDYIAKEYPRQLEQLPFNDATVIALLSSLVASNSEVFVGSVFSTFTAAIHRRRLFKDPKQPMLFVSNPYDGGAILENCEFKATKTGHFSWNRLALPNPPEAKANAWFREWPEAAS